MNNLNDIFFTPAANQDLTYDQVLEDVQRYFAENHASTIAEAGEGNAERATTLLKELMVQYIVKRKYAIEGLTTEELCEKLYEDILMVFLVPLMVPVLIGLAVALWFSTYYSVFDFVKKRRKLIESEIPRFALTIGQNLENDRDVLKILTSYRRVAGKDFGAELDQTIADMKTGNYENALIRFETRIGSPMLSDVIRGLIGVLRGDDQRMYFKMICFDMRQIEQNNLKKEAAKRPKKIQRYSMMMLICIMIIYLVVLCTEVMGSLGAFFG